MMGVWQLSRMHLSACTSLYVYVHVYVHVHVHVYEHVYVHIVLYQVRLHYFPAPQSLPTCVDFSNTCDFFFAAVQGFNVENPFTSRNFKHSKSGFWTSGSFSSRDCCMSRKRCM